MDKLPISRAQLAGKRRIVIYIGDLANYSGLAPSILYNELHDSKLRQGIDYVYHPKKEDFALSLAAAQAVLLGYQLWGSADITAAWQTWHAISDFINQGFNHDNKQSTSQK